MHDVRALIQVAPKEAMKKILDAFRRHGCHRGRTAKALGCHQHTLEKWVLDLGLREQLEKIEDRARKEGWHHGNAGGAGTHRDPESAIRKRSATFAAKRAAKEVQRS